MFGKEYFETRRRLDDVVGRVLELSDKAGGDKEPLLEEGVVKSLTEPVLFTVCGEVNAGKSTFLNALLGEDLCEVNTLPNTKCVQWYRYDIRSHDKTSSPILEERFRPYESLIDFNLVDTPGSNTLNKQQLQTIDHFVGLSDLIFWIFPIANPWGAETWDLISKLSEEGLSKSVIIIQQVDMRNEQDLEVILGHMSDLSRKRVGMVPKIFPVSGKLALEARGTKSQALWSKSGYSTLEEYISPMIRYSEAHQQELRHVRDATAQVLRSTEDAIELRQRLLEGNEDFLRDIEMEVEDERVRQSSDFDGKFSDMRQVFISQSAKLKTIIGRRLSVIPTVKSFFSAENISKQIEKSLVDSVELAVEQQANLDANSLVEECRKHWDSVRPRVREKLSLSLPDFDEETGGFQETSGLFIERMGEASRHTVAKLNMRVGIDMQLFERRRRLRKWLYATLILLTLSGIFGGFNVAPSPFLALGVLALSIVAGAGFVFQTLSTRTEVITDLTERMEDARIPFADALGVDYREGLRDFYLEYGNLLESVRRHIYNAKLELQPNLEEWNGLFLELKEIEQNL